MSMPVASRAQGYPSKPVRLIVGFPPGGISDGLARVAGQHLSTALGQQVLVDNRPGAGTTIAAELTARSAPDGYTLYFADVTTHAINATLYGKLPYDSFKDFTPIALVATTPLILVVHPSLPVKSVAELIALARKHPGQINYASSGNGTILHLSGETLKTMAGIDLVHIPYKGSAPAVAALLGGEVALTFSTTPAALPHVRSGKVRSLAVSSARRNALIPEVPALAETLPGFDIILYSGVMGPAGMARDIVGRLNTELGRMLQQAKVKEVWAGFGADTVSATPEQFGEHLKADIDKLGKLVKASGAHID